MKVDVQKLNSFYEKFNQLKGLLVVGDVGVDCYTKGEVNRISPEAPVPIVEVKDRWRKLGLAANVSDNLKSLGVSSTLCGLVGKDQNSACLEDLLEEIKLQTWGLIPSEKRMTIFKERVVAGSQQICRIDYETNQSIDEEEEAKFLKRLEDLYEGHDGVIIENYGKGSLNEQICQQIIEKQKEAKMKVFVDPSRHNSAYWYKGAYLLKPNRIEAEVLCKELKIPTQNLEGMTAGLIEKLDLENVVVTLGAKGMATLNRSSGKFQVIPTFARDVFDVSGAGDTAISVLSLMLMVGASLEEAVWLSNCASAIVVGKRGTATANREEIRRFVEKQNQNNETL